MTTAGHDSEKAQANNAPQDAVSKDPNIVDFEGLDDLDNPMNWSSGKKTTQIVIVTTMTLLSQVTCSPGVTLFNLSLDPSVQLLTYPPLWTSSSTSILRTVPSVPWSPPSSFSAIRSDPLSLPLSPSSTAGLSCTRYPCFSSSSSTWRAPYLTVLARWSHIVSWLA